VTIVSSNIVTERRADESETRHHVDNMASTGN